MRITRLSDSLASHLYALGGHREFRLLPRGLLKRDEWPYSLVTPMRGVAMDETKRARESHRPEQQVYTAERRVGGTNTCLYVVRFHRDVQRMLRRAPRPLIHDSPF